jgi:hypothetical protein
MIRGVLLLSALGAGLAGLTVLDAAAQANPFQRMLGLETRQSEPSVWYVRADGRGQFIFDRSSQPALLRLEGDDEVYALRRASAAGGGEVWLTDTGRQMLRQSNLGGWTYFPEDNPDGVLVEQVGRAQTLVAPLADNAALERAASDMVNQLSRSTRRNISAELTSLAPDQNPYVIDAMAMINRAAGRASRRALRDFEIVRIGVAEAPAASFDGRVLDVSVAPELGYGGRPSSEFLRRVLEQGRN